MTRADRATDALYEELRGSFRGSSARANGYRFHAYFVREQAHILKLIGVPSGLVVDVGCGSGLMLRPLMELGVSVVGVDFNELACRDARANGLGVARGDAFRLPLADRSVHTCLASQFLNQQDAAAARELISEIARVLEEGGRFVLVWRNGRALIHRAAHTAYAALDALKGAARFPYVNHAMADVTAWAAQSGLAVERRQAVLSLCGLRFGNPDGLGSKILGASYVAVLRKPPGES